MIDTHTHIFDPRFDADRNEALARALALGVDGFVVPATVDSEHERMIEICASTPWRYYPTMGLHPTAMNDNPQWREHLQRVEKFLSDGVVHFVAVGETGLDLHWSKDFLAEQIEAFQTQIEMSIRYDLPLVIHARDAWDELLPIMEPYAGRMRGVFHSFSGTVCQIEKIEALGGFLYGINGTVTYKKSTLPEAIKYIPIEKIIIETDSPYLPPEPYRGKRNESSYVSIVCAKVADLKEITLAQADEITTKNAIKMFNLDPLRNVKNNI